ncbi:SDR family oxidoreductase [Streptomyces sp. DSM 41972]|uniref:SDR family oxidoreductase n=1 Tax=Streptomyces althioticus subsp. attaecolombicae TaxID=3075534 RepID=A0ABU3HYN9_9ACTN|nr:SDR family oxidoreductase [Streptomyces sp. DSM 41972]SCD58734.1 Short-chain dehydrogenase [Streptomyces sp. di188]SCD59238.1 Short-chain dehydrogenase [Streptomyces sp. di50b]
MRHAPSRSGTAGASDARTPALLPDDVREPPGAAAQRPGTALVTGASSGIGAAVARRLSAEGWRLVLSGRDAGRLAETAAHTAAAVFPEDLTRPAAERRLTRFALDEVGHLDLMVACAGVGWAGDFARMTRRSFDEVMEVNVLTTLRLVRQVLPHMEEAGSGRVVLVGSLAGAVGVRGEAAYSASKAAVAVFADALRYELRGTGVGVSLVVPGVVDTPFFERRGTPYARTRPRPVPPERVADAVWRAAVRGRDEVYVPAWLRLPARVRGAAPGLYRRLAATFG